MSPSEAFSRRPQVLRGLIPLVTMEHADDFIPAPFDSELVIPTDVLRSHRGSDLGSKDLGFVLGDGIGASILHMDVTRLLVDCNVSADHPERLSEYSRKLSPELQAKAMEMVWDFHRDRVTKMIGQCIDGGNRVLHVSVHSFPPELDGVRRDVDIGLLYDPQRSLETAAIDWLLPELEPRFPELSLERNKPYLGTEDSLTATLRKEHGEDVYAGITLEVSQRFEQDETELGEDRWENMQYRIAEAFSQAFVA